MSKDKPSSSPISIVWAEKEGKFETQDKEAFLQYQIRDKNKMDMQHTFVPRSKRGMGLAALLCDKAFEHAKTHNLLVIPSCSYISETYLPRNPAWNSILYKEEPKSSM